VLFAKFLILETLLAFARPELIEADEIYAAMGDTNIYRLTEKGKEFIAKWINADSVE